MEERNLPIGIVIEVEYAEGGRLDAACRKALDSGGFIGYTVFYRE